MKMNKTRPLNKWCSIKRITISVSVSSILLQCRPVKWTRRSTAAGSITGSARVPTDVGLSSGTRPRRSARMRWRWVNWSTNYLEILYWWSSSSLGAIEQRMLHESLPARQLHADLSNARLQVSLWRHRVLRKPLPGALSGAPWTGRSVSRRVHHHLRKMDRKYDHKNPHETIYIESIKHSSGPIFIGFYIILVM